MRARDPMIIKKMKINCEQKTHDGQKSQLKMSKCVTMLNVSVLTFNIIVSKFNIIVPSFIFNVSVLVSSTCVNVCIMYWI